MKKILVLMLALALMCMSFASCGCQEDKSDIEAIKKAGKITVGVTIYDPMDYKDEGGNWIGFDAELAQMFAQSLGVDCEIVIINWNSKVAELNSKQIDLIWNGMTVSDELSQKIDTSISYAKNAQVAVVRSDSTITAETVTNANNSFAFESGSAGETVVKETLNITNVEKLNSIVENGQLGALNEVLSGNSDVAIIDITMAQSKIGKGAYSGLKIVEGASYGEENFAVGMRKGSDLKAELDSFLKAKYQDGTITALAEKYTVGINTEELGK